MDRKRNDRAHYSSSSRSMGSRMRNGSSSATSSRGTQGEDPRPNENERGKATKKNTEDYYTILKLNRNASQADIRKAYRRLALRWHPDKNPDNQEEAAIRFKDISEAYEVLIDQDKRRMYDQYGKAGLAGSANSGSSSWAQQDGLFGKFRKAEDVFKEFFRHDFDLSDLCYEGNMSDGCIFEPSNSFRMPSVFSPFVSGREGYSQFSTSESTTIVGNKKTVTKKVVKNGVETITVTENGVLKLKTVNGVPQALEF
ncbi:dnaJ homolog subfamily B member 6-B-like [Artemia franciscana]|uniref:J domain-containing protein n=1 Tax=Artemia franciscana TaxID=6661 RepID=A0AA88L9A1_ARTSF|nr:hypothetical protein QYM36_007301 [Artemia franciscana]